jgi:hypothetical protein
MSDAVTRFNASSAIQLLGIFDYFRQEPYWAESLLLRRNDARALKKPVNTATDPEFDRTPDQAKLNKNPTFANI